MMYFITCNTRRSVKYVQVNLIIKGTATKGVLPTSSEPIILHYKIIALILRIMFRCVYCLVNRCELGHIAR